MSRSVAAQCQAADHHIPLAGIAHAEFIGFRRTLARGSAGSYDGHFLFPRQQGEVAHGIYLRGTFLSYRKEGCGEESVRLFDGYDFHINGVLYLRKSANEEPFPQGIC